MHIVAAERVRRALVNAMRILHDRGLINLRGGNASALVEVVPGLTYIYVTPRGKPKPLLMPADIAVVTLDGGVVEGEPTSELPLHLEVYRRVEGARAVVHAHNPLAVAAVEAGLAGSLAVSSVESRYYIGGCVGVVEPLEPGSRELAYAAARELMRCPVAVLRGHGAVAVGYASDPVEAVYEAVDRLEALEDSARIVLARLLARVLSSSQPRP